MSAYNSVVCFVYSIFVLCYYIEHDATSTEIHVNVSVVIICI